MKKSSSRSRPTQRKPSPPEDLISLDEPVEEPPQAAPTAAEPAPTWEELGGLAFLQRWAAQLRRAREAGTPEAWRLAGRGVLLLGPEPDRGAAVLRRVAADAGFAFRSVTIDLEQSGPFLMELADHAPVLAFLRPGAWQFSREATDSHPTAMPSTVAELQERLMLEIQLGALDRAVVLVACADDEDSFSPLLRVAGAFDRCLQLPAVSPLDRAKAFIAALGRERCAESLLAAPGKLGHLVSHWLSDARVRDLAVLHLLRVHAEVDRPLEIADVFEVALRGTVESPGGPRPEARPDRRHVAIHEAGHAVVAILDSAGANCPDFCTVIPSPSFEGVVVGSLAYHHESEGELTYDRFRHDIRVSLGGRAAEEVLLGAEQVSRGASADLGACTRRSADAFGRYGFAPDMGAPGASAGNLAVLTGPPTASQTLHLEGLTRAFLAREYLAVLEILRQHRALLEAVADRMVWDAVVDQGELRAMCASLQIPLSRRSPE